MLTYLQARQSAARHTAQGQNLTRHNLQSADLAGFWNKCQIDANFLITGGSANRRTDMLFEMITSHAARSPFPIILLTGSATTAAALHSGQYGRLAVSSPRAPIYHPLFRIDAIRLCQLVMALAEAKHYPNPDRLEPYVRAFIEIAYLKYGPSLDGLLRLDRACPTPAQLFTLGQSLGVGYEFLGELHAYPAGSTNLRTLLNLLSEAYRSLSSPALRQRTSLLTSVAKNHLSCIHVASPQPEILDLALAYELEQLVSLGQPFLLILDDLPLYSADGLYKTAIRIKNASGSHAVGIAVQNAPGWAAAMAHIPGAGDALLGNIPNVALFHTPGETDGDLETVLGYFGSCDKYEPMISPEARGFHPFPTLEAIWTVHPAGLRPRVEARDIADYALLLKGHSGRQIHLYRNLPDSPGLISTILPHR